METPPLPMVEAGKGEPPTLSVEDLLGSPAPAPAGDEAAANAQRVADLFRDGGAVYWLPEGGTFTAAEFAEANDGEPVDPRILALSPGETVEIDFGAGGVVPFTRMS